MYSFQCLLFFLGIIGGKSFVPTSVLSGPAGPDMSMFAVPKTVAFKYLKKCHIEQIQKDAPKQVIQEFHDAREITRDFKKTNSHFSFLVPKDMKDENLFTIVYRMTETFPVIYTIEAIIREPNSSAHISTLALESILNQMIVDRKGFMQIHELGTWSSGRYKKEMMMERQFQQ